MALCGEDSPVHKLTEKEVIEMRDLFATGDYILEDLAKRYGVVASTVYNIVQGYSWRHVKGGKLAPIQKRYGEKSAHHTLTQAQVDAIREEWRTGETTQVSLARKYHVSQCAIWKIVNNISWRNE